MKYGAYEAEERYYDPSAKVIIPEPAHFCGKCGLSLTDTDFFCSVCGLRHLGIEYLEPHKVTNCRTCRAPYKFNANFCTFCGTSVDRSWKKMPVCRDCEVLISEKYPFCKKCGMDCSSQFLKLSEESDNPTASK